MTSKLETEILHWRTKTAAYMVFAKARLTEVIEQLCYYQLLCIYSADGFQSRAFANTRTVACKHVRNFDISGWKLIFKTV